MKRRKVRTPRHAQATERTLSKGVAPAEGLADKNAPAKNHASEGAKATAAEDGNHGRQRAAWQACGGETTATAATSASWRQTLLAAGVIVLAGVAAYCNSFGGVFAYDDQGSIVENTTIRHLWPIWPVLVPPHSGETVSGRPLLNLSLAINYAISGLNVWSYHAANLLIHIGATLLLFGILRRTFLLPVLRDRFGKAATTLALASALLWMLHPLQTESITYIVQRAESLAGLFYLLTLYCVIRGATGSAGVPPASASAGEMPALRRHDEKRGLPWYAAAVLACLLGTACKEILITAPLLVLLYDRTFLAGSFAAALRRRWGLYVGLAATWGLLAYLVFSTGLIGRQAELGAPDSWSYARTQPSVILYYLRLTIWPSRLCMSYDWREANTLGEILPGAIVVGLLLAVTIYGTICRKPWGFLGAWFFLILAPTSSVMPLKQLIHEHRMYLSLATIAVLVVTGGYALCDRLLPMPAGASFGALLARWAGPAVVFAIALTVLGSATVVRNSDYRSALAIWEDGVKKSPNNFLAHTNLGLALAAVGKTEEAIEHYRQALRLNPDFTEAHNNLGNALAGLGRTEEAIEHYRQAFRMSPALALNNLGLLLAGLGRTEEAIRQYNEALRLNPDYADAHYNLGIALAGLSRIDEAIQHYQQALWLKPDYVKAHNNLGVALIAKGRVEEATEHYRQALRLNPDNVEACNNLGIALARLGRTNEAIESYHQALRLRPDHAEAHNNLATVLIKVGKIDEATEHYREALRLRPNYAEAYCNLVLLRYIGLASDWKSA